MYLFIYLCLAKKNKERNHYLQMTIGIFEKLLNMWYLLLLLLLCVL